MSTENPDNIFESENEEVHHSQIMQQSGTVARKLAMFFFLIDVSNPSQDEEYYKKVNDALANIIAKIYQTQLKINEIECKIAIMIFDENAQWSTMPTAIIDFQLNKIVSGTNHKVSFDSAFEELNNKLTRNQFMRHKGRICPPYVFLMSNMIMEKQDDHSEALNKLLQNGWFSTSSRYYFYLRDTTSHFHISPLISQFVSDESDGVINLSDIDNLNFPRTTIHTVDIGHHTMDIELDARGHIRSSDDKELNDLAEALYNGDTLTVDSEGIVHLLDELDNNDSFSGPIIRPGAFAGGDNIQCRACGKFFERGNKYCPMCGTIQLSCVNNPFRETIQFSHDNNLRISKVNFSAVAPKKLARDVFNIIHLIAYEDEVRSIVDRVLHDKEIPQKEFPAGISTVTENSLIRIELKSSDIDLVYEDERVWKQKYIDFSIPVKLSSDFKKKQVMFQVNVYINDIIATRLSFVIKCGTFRTQKISIAREDILSAFISYASQDRGRAAMVVQGIRKARPDMDIFFDVETLRSGEDWKNTIHQEIGNRDILYLFWSSYAKESKWVDAEWRYAYSINGEDGIEPIPLEPAWSCPPPEELKSKHFNDNLLYLINQDASGIRSMLPRSTPGYDNEITFDKDYLVSKMSELKELLEIGLYTKDEYEADRKALLESYRKQQHFLG